MRITITLPTNFIEKPIVLTAKDFKDTPSLPEIERVMNNFLDNDRYEDQTENYSLSYVRSHKPAQFYLYSFRWCIGHINAKSTGEKTLSLNTRFYSEITGNHQYLLKRLAQDKGFLIDECMTDGLDYAHQRTNWED